MIKKNVIFLLVLAAIACNLPAYSAQVPTLPPAQTPILITPTPEIPTATPTPEQPAYTPVFEATACRFAVPEDTTPRCGDVIVPEDRMNPAGRQVRLHTAIWRSPSPDRQPDPVILLSGGPGSSALALAGYIFSAGIGEVTARRDLILFDQRGTGESDPALNCPEREAITAQLLAPGLTLDQSSALALEAYHQCHDRLVAEGINLAMYNSAASAADVNDIRRALGYEQINLYGTSYGTRLALTVMRDHPEGVRSVVLDSVYPPQFDLYTSLPANAERAITALFDACAADADCAARYPNIKAKFYALVNQLNESPQVVTITDPNTGQPVDILFNGGLLIDTVFVGLYPPFFIGRVPLLISEVERGNYYSSLPARLQLYFDQSSARGMQLSVQCHEEIPFGSIKMLDSQSQSVQAEVKNYFRSGLQGLYQTCAFWGAGQPDPVENQPVSSDIQTLLLTGRFDPITPPEWAAQAAQTLSHSTVYEFPNSGHWQVRYGRCPVGIMLAFLQDPFNTPDGSCIDGLGGVNFE
jgi:pimeloyl-ACP methyl ester carboxylesterase